MSRTRKFSVWRSVLQDDANITASQEPPGYVRKRVKTITKAFFSPWAEKGNVDGSQFAVISPPKRPTLQNLGVFLRNSKVTPDFEPQFAENNEKVDLAIKILFAGSLVGALLVIVLILAG